MALGKFGALVICKPEQASKEMLSAYRRASAKVGDACEALEISRCAWHAYVGKLGLRGEIARLKREAKDRGWHHGDLGGRPKGSKNREGKGGDKNVSPNEAKTLP